MCNLQKQLDHEKKARQGLIRQLRKYIENEKKSHIIKNENKFLKQILKTTVSFIQERAVQNSARNKTGEFALNSFDIRRLQDDIEKVLQTVK